MNGKIDYKQKYEQAQGEILVLKEELAQLKRLIFGSKSERFVAELPQEQQRLDFGEEVTQVEEQPTRLVQYEKKQSTHKPTGILPIPAHLPRETIIIEPEQDVTGWKKIGEEVTESLEHKPGKLYVKQFVRPKYAKPEGDAIVIGELSSRPIEKCQAGATLLALILIEKYVDHLPLYRQLERLKREGVKIPASTVNDWVTGTCKLLYP